MPWPPVTSTHCRSSGQHGCDPLSPHIRPESASRYFLPWPRHFPNTSWFDLSFLLGQQICKPQVSSISLKRKKRKGKSFSKVLSSLPIDQGCQAWLSPSAAGQQIQELTPQKGLGRLRCHTRVPPGSPCQSRKVFGPHTNRPLILTGAGSKVHCQGTESSPAEVPSGSLSVDSRL